MIGGTADTATSGFSFKHFGTDIYCGTNKGLFRSNDDGTSWQPLTYSSAVVASLNVQAVTRLASGDIYAGTDARLYKSTDNGSTWSWINTIPDNIPINDIIEKGSNIVVAYGTFSAGGAYYSSDGGTTWNVATGLPNHRMAHFLIDGTSLYLAGYLSVYVSTDNGQSWVVSGTGWPTSFGSFFDVVKSGNAFFAGDVTGNGMYGSYDGAVTWSRIDTMAFLPFCQVFSVTEANNTIVASMDGTCNAGGNTPIKMSNDTGHVWNTYMTGLPSNYYQIVGRNTAGTSFFTRRGNGKEVYRTSVPVSVPSLSIENNNISVFPNPADNNITISSRVNEKKEISIYDCIGNKILSKETTSESETISISNLASGFYFVKIKNKTGKVSMAKFVKE